MRQPNWMSELKWEKVQADWRLEEAGMTAEDYARHAIEAPINRQMVIDRDAMRAALKADIEAVQMTIAKVPTFRADRTEADEATLIAANVAFNVAYQAEREFVAEQQKTFPNYK